MSERYMTMAEIEAAYPDQWMLLDQPTHDRTGAVSGGKVLWHHPELDGFNRRLLEFRRSARMAVFYTTPAPATDTDTDVISVWTSDSTHG